MTDYAAISERLGVPENILRFIDDHVRHFEGQGKLTLPAFDGHTTLSGVTEKVWSEWSRERADITNMNHAQAANDLIAIRHGRDGASMGKEAFEEQTLLLYYDKYVVQPGYDNFPEWAQIQAMDFGINAGNTRARWAMGKALLQADEVFDNIEQEREVLATHRGDDAPVVQALDRIIASGNVPDIFNEANPNPFPFASTAESLQKNFANNFPVYARSSTSDVIASELASIENAAPNAQAALDIALVLNDSASRFRRTYYSELSKVEGFEGFSRGWQRRANELQEDSDGILLTAMEGLPQTSPLEQQILLVAAQREAALAAATTLANSVNMDYTGMRPTLVEADAYTTYLPQLCIGAPGTISPDLVAREADFDRAFVQILKLEAHVPDEDKAAVGVISEGFMHTFAPDETNENYAASIITSAEAFEACDPEHGLAVATVMAEDIPGRGGRGSVG